jgi:hypothetical protein
MGATIAGASAQKRSELGEFVMGAAREVAAQLASESISSAAAVSRYGDFGLIVLALITPLPR